MEEGGTRRKKGRGGRRDGGRRDGEEGETGGRRDEGREKIKKL